MATLNHTHKYRRYTTKTGTQMFFCALPKCSHRIPVKLSLGKLCICWRCGREFELTVYSYRLAKPHCPDCQHYKPGNEPQETIVPANEMKVIRGSQERATANEVIDITSRLRSAIGLDSDQTEDDDL